MLKLKGACERCETPLPPESDSARICSFECTFCVTCVEGPLAGVCPNCGGNFQPRPVRPAELLERVAADSETVEVRIPTLQVAIDQLDDDAGLGLEHRKVTSRRGRQVEELAFRLQLEASLPFDPGAQLDAQLPSEHTSPSAHHVVQLPQ